MSHNDSVECTGSITIPSHTNAFIKCEVPKIMKSRNCERVCVFEPSYRHKSNQSHCITYEVTMVMDNDIVNSGIFQIVMANHSPEHVKIITKYWHVEIMWWGKHMHHTWYCSLWTHWLYNESQCSWKGTTLYSYQKCFYCWNSLLKKDKSWLYILGRHRICHSIVENSNYVWTLKM